ncbi:uroporphyrinogen decarboxylase family protein [Chloroflexota bacterium]
MEKPVEPMQKKTGKSPEELYEEREKRVRDTIGLKEPDRVPVVMGMAYFAAKYTGLPPSAAYYDTVAWKEAIKKTVLDFEPDLYRVESAVNSGFVLEALDAKQTRWPGGTLPPDTTHQFVEGEYMKEDEYDLFLADPSDFVMRYYLPRVFGALQPLSKLPPLSTLIAAGDFTSITTLFATPEFKQFAKALSKAGQEQKKYDQVMNTFEEEMVSLGFPPHRHVGGVGGAPFDAISDNLRGMRGTMIDMYRNPDKLLQACELILQMRIARAVPSDSKKRGNPKRVFMPLHRGAEGFMSRKQFETFYWPGLKKAILTTIDLGYVPMPFFEGHYGDRLEYLLELPKGKVVCHFEHMDMARAKEVLGGHLCIMGNVPSSLLQVGSPQEVEEYCRNLIKVCGKGGGFILTNASSIDEAKAANIKAMVDSVKKYGVYT